MSNMLMIDNAGGFGAAIMSSNEYNGAEVQVRENIVYGEATEISDCP